MSDEYRVLFFLALLVLIRGLAYVDFRHAPADEAVQVTSVELVLDQSD